MMPRSCIAVLVALAAAVLAACGSGDGEDRGAAAGPTVVATTTQVGDLARQVAGERARVRQLIAANADPHEYEPRPSDVRAVGGAGVVLRSGGDLDRWLDGVLGNAGTDVRAVTLIEAVRTRREKGAVDPHWWHDPRNAIRAAGRIRDALIAADPGGRSVYAANAGAYIATLRALDRAIAACFARVPERRRRLVTDHDALGYYADRYGIEVVGTVVPALSTQAQSSAGEIARLADTIRAERVTAIFPESSASPRLARAIARDTGANLGAALYADSLGAEGSAGASYVGSMRANTTALVDGFTDGRMRCDLPA